MVKSFAERQMEKMGWKVGQGLGASNQGITDAIKPTLKMDSTGLGFVRGDEDCGWWQDVYNTSAKKIRAGGQRRKKKKVKGTGESDEESKTEATNETAQVDAIESDSDGPGLTIEDVLEKRNKTKMKFVSGGKIKNLMELAVDVETSQEISVKPKKKKNKSAIVSYEDMLKKCGGRTVHKAARHGFSMSGKLARVESQDDSELLARMQASLERKR